MVNLKNTLLGLVLMAAASSQGMEPNYPPQQSTDSYVEAINEINPAKVKELLKNHVPLNSAAIRRYIFLHDLTQRQLRMAEASCYQTPVEVNQARRRNITLAEIGHLFGTYIKNGGAKPNDLTREEWKYFKDDVYPFYMAEDVEVKTEEQIARNARLDKLMESTAQFLKELQSQKAQKRP